MAQNETNADPQGGKQRAQRVGRLHTVGQIVSEMGKLYRQARKGEINSADASRLASILALMRQGLEASDLERRLTELEGGDGEPKRPVFTRGVSLPDHRPLPAREKVPA